jgi:hypothetical protein
MVGRIVRPLVTVAAATQVAVGAAVAQHRFEFGPIVGYYRPMGSFEPTTVTRVPFPAVPADKSGLALGVRWRAWHDAGHGVEVELLEARSVTDSAFTPIGWLGPHSIRVQTVAARAVFAVASAEPWRLWLSGGGGMVRHAGRAYSGLKGTIDLAATAGFGTRLRLYGGFYPSAALSLFLYQLDVRGSTRTSVQRGVQVDPVLELGVMWGWSRGSGR